VELERQLSGMLAAQSERDQRLAQLTDELARKSAQLEEAEANVAEAMKRAELVLELERQLSATLAAQTRRDQRLAQLTDELALKSVQLKQAESNAAEAAKRAGLELSEHADRPLAQTSLVEQKDAELVKMQAKLDELLLSRDHQHVRALEQALQKATSRTADADERSQRACEQLAQYETELAGVRAELEARNSELEAVKSEADTLRALTTAGLVSTDEGRITRGLLERLRIMEADMASLRFSEKGSESMQSRNEG